MLTLSVELGSAASVKDQALTGPVMLKLPHGGCAVSSLNCSRVAPASPASFLTYMAFASIVLTCS